MGGNHCYRDYDTGKTPSRLHVPRYEEGKHEMVQIFITFVFKKLHNFLIFALKIQQDKFILFQVQSFLRLWILNNLKHFVNFVNPLKT